MNWFERIAVGVIALFITISAGGLVFWGVDSMTGEWSEPFNAVVVERSYSPSSTQTGTGFMPNAKGGNLIVTTSHASEKWVVIVKSGDTVQPVNSSREMWSIAEAGAPVTVQAFIGGISGWCLKWGITSIP